MDKSYFIYPFLVEEYLCCFSFLALMNNTLSKYSIHICVNTGFEFSPVPRMVTSYGNSVNVFKIHQTVFPYRPTIL